MKFAAKYSRAVRSSNLRDDEQHHGTEALAAMALVSAAAENALGPALFRVKYAGDASSYPRLAEQWSEMLRKKAAKHNWPLHIIPSHIAALSLTYWLSDVCPECTGRGYPVVLNTPMLSENECPACRGTGNKPLVCDPDEKFYIQKALDQLDIMILRAGDAAVRKLAREFD